MIVVWLFSGCHEGPTTCLGPKGWEVCVPTPTDPIVLDHCNEAKPS